MDVELFVRRTKAYGFGKMVYFALHYVNEVFPHTIPDLVMEALQPESLAYLSEVLDANDVVHTWNQPIRKRFFHINRSLEIKSILFIRSSVMKDPAALFDFKEETT